MMRRARIAMIRGLLQSGVFWLALVKDDSKTVGQLVKEASGTLGEAISIKRFARFRIGED